MGFVTQIGNILKAKIQTDSYVAEMIKEQGWEEFEKDYLIDSNIVNNTQLAGHSINNPMRAPDGLNPDYFKDDDEPEFDEEGNSIKL